MINAIAYSILIAAGMMLNTTSPIAVMIPVPGNLDTICQGDSNARTVSTFPECPSGEPVISEAFYAGTLSKPSRFSHGYALDRLQHVLTE